MTRAKKKEVLSENELRGLREEQRELEATLKTVEDHGKGTPAESLDQPALHRQLSRIKEAIKDGEPGKISGVQKDKIAERARELEEGLKRGICSRDEMENLKRNPGAPLKNLRWQRDNASAVKEWRQAQRILNPGDPTSGNLDRLRR
jgi:hypothetical protein